MTKLTFLIFSNPYSSEWKFDCRQFGVFFFKEKNKIKKLPLRHQIDGNQISIPNYVGLKKSKKLFGCKWLQARRKVSEKNI